MRKGMTCRGYTQHHFFGKKNGAGYTIVELLVVIALIAVLTTASSLILFGRRGTTELTTTTQKVTALLREAESRSMSQASGQSWGVFLNASSTPQQYSLFSGTTYSTSSGSSNQYVLPSSVRFRNIVGSTTITFAQITGVPSTSTSIIIDLMGGASTVLASATITVDPSGDIR